jgi:hypothetical protein
MDQIKSWKMHSISGLSACLDHFSEGLSEWGTRDIEKAAGTFPGISRSWNGSGDVQH